MTHGLMKLNIGIMASSNKITDDELLARIQGELSDSLGYGDPISQQREKSME